MPLYHLSSTSNSNLGATQAAYLLPTLRSQHKQPYDPPVVVRGACVPDHSQFKIRQDALARRDRAPDKTLSRSEH